jgi:hypothetical protein
MKSLVDQFVPTFDVSDAVGTIVNADVATTWRAVLETDLVEVARKKPLVGALGALRGLPDVLGSLLHGERPPKPPASMRLKDLVDLPMNKGGWLLLGERPNEELALGLVGRFWQPIITFAEVSAAEFARFNEPNYAKTVYSLSVTAVDSERTFLRGTMQTATTDAHARRRFRQYWTLGIGSGAHVLVSGVLDVAKERAEFEQTARLSGVPG